MKHKTAELQGALLDAAVALAEGYDQTHGRIVATLLFDHETRVVDNRPAYSTDWAHGGPIIEREGIATEPNDDFADPKRGWLAWLVHPARPDGVQRSHASGPTPLTAAMRAYVASKLGEEVELP